MAKEKSEEKEARRREKKERKEKEMLIGTNGIQKAAKEKTAKKHIAAADAEEVHVTTKLLNSLESEKHGYPIVKEDDSLQVKVKAAPLIGALVPFANPLADEKQQKKILKSVKKGQSVRKARS